MAITDYSTLKSAVADWLNRSDLTSAIETFVQLADKRLARDLAGADSFTELSSGNTTNWLLTSHPDVYLYASLVESAPYLKDDERVVTWEAEYAKRVDLVRRARSSSDYSFATYSGLQTAVAGWLDRDDLVGAIKSFIALAEAKMKRDRRFRKLTALAASITDDSYDFPTDFQSLESWYHDGSTYYGAIEIVGADQIGAMKAIHGDEGVPRFAAIVDGVARFAPAPDTTYSTKATYWAGVTALSDSATSNWLLLAHPDLYLYGALMEAAPYLKDDARIMVWRDGYERGAEELHAKTWHAQNGGTMRRQIRRVIGG